MPVPVTPTVRAVGAIANNVGAIAPGLPAGTVAGDLLVMFLETNDEAITVAGWTQLPTVSPQSVAGVTRLTVFYKVAVGGDATTTSDSGDHQIGRIVGIAQGTFNASAPIDSSAGGVRSPAGTTATVPGPTTTQALCLILAASSHELDQTGGAFTTASWANANLTGIAERINNSTTDGTGGGLAVASGVKSTAGAVGNTTVTVASSVGGMIALAIAPGSRGEYAISQAAVEAIYTPNPRGRVSQAPVEALYTPITAGRTSQLPVEVLITPLSGAVIEQLPVEVVVEGWVPLVLPTYFVVGELEVPAGGGTQVVHGLGSPGKTPKGIVFMGANWVDEDIVVPAAGAAVFRGMVAPQWDSPGTLAQHAAAVGPGDQHRAASSAILNVSSAGSATVLYQANVTSLDDDGFTLSWATGAAGYKVVFAVLFEAEQCVGHVGLVNTVLSGVGFKAGASLVHGAWAGPTISGSDRSQEWYGGAAYPTTAYGNWMSAGMSTQCFPTSQSQQNQVYLDAFKPNIQVVSGQHFLGPFLVGSVLKMHPQGVDLEDFLFTGDSTNGGMVMLWDDSDSATGYATPSSSVAGVVFEPTPFDPGLVLGYSVSNEPRAQQTGGRGAAGFSMIGTDANGDPYQWGALVDRINPGALQSFSRIPNVVSDSAVQTFEGELVAGGFELTTVDVGAPPVSWLWHAFGHPRPPQALGIVLPQIYRRIVNP